MPDHRNDLLALLKQRGQPFSRETTAEDRHAKKSATLKQGDRPGVQRKEKELPRSNQSKALKQSSRSDNPKQSAALKQSGQIDTKRPAALKQRSDDFRIEEIPHNLPEVLKQQLSAVNELIELSLAEVEAFKIDDVARIRSIFDQQEKVIDRMQVLEQCRMKAGLPVPPCLIERVKRLQQINETNRLLARMALSLNKMMQKALGLMPSGSYDHKGMPSALEKVSGRLVALA